MDYDSLLVRGIDELPESAEGRGRSRVPAAQVTRQGKKTLVTDFGDICSAPGRDPAGVARHLLRELGTAGSRSGGRMAPNGSFRAEDVDGAVKKDAECFVLCKVCRLPDTKLLMESRQAYIWCEACGAKYQARG